MQDNVNPNPNPNPTSNFLWDYLCNASKAGTPIVMYGTGDGADKILAVMERYGLKPACFTASGDFPMKRTFRDYRVLPFDEVQRRFSGFIMLVCFGTHRPDVIRRVYELSERYEVYAPDVPVAGGDLSIFTPDYVSDNSAKLDRVRKLLADEKSREVFDGWLQYRLSGKIDILEQIASPRAEVLSLLKLKDNGKEFFIDVGAFKGDTIEEFLEQTGGKFAKIVAIEPDLKNLTALRRKFYAHGNDVFTSVHAAAWDCDLPVEFAVKTGKSGAGRSPLIERNFPLPKPKVEGGSPLPKARVVEVAGIKLDTLCNGGKDSAPTLIKIDAEGAESKVLQGARSTIAKHRPKLLVSLYHRAEDMYALPLLLHSFCPQYRFYLRKTWCLPGWEFQLCCTL